VSRLSIRRVHSLSPGEARARVARAAQKLTERFGATCRWNGEVLSIEHPSVHGSVTLLPTEIAVEAELGGALGLFRRRAESEITRILDRELGE
jgi:putative polyhydroxyalkanoate system protein